MESKEPKLFTLAHTINRDKLKEIEKRLQESMGSVAIPGTEKLFVTFPYPYMNGPLHLGHSYTMSKIIFLTRFCKTNGINTLFPFGYHGTGMPIVACAKKLEHDMNQTNPEDYNKLPVTSQVSILKSVGIADDQLKDFIDPNYWIKYFPEQAYEHLKLFNAPIDHSRSFVTTEMNQYYDNFIKWQFKKLNEKGILQYGKRYTIFSKATNQPCLGQDRSVGEDVEPKQYIIAPIKVNDETFMATVYQFGPKSSQAKQDPDLARNPCEEKICTGTKTHNFYKFNLNGQEYWTTENAFNNLTGQYDVTELEHLDAELMTFNLFTDQFESIDKYSPTHFMLFVKNIEEYIKSNQTFAYYEPESQVIARTGEICTVALTPQWFINYDCDNGYYKNIVKNHINSNNFKTDPQVLNQLNKIVDWIKEWPCTRYYGLGTKFLDTENVIDSLSDSTIYMAYYTIANTITKIPINILTRYRDEIFDSIFMDKDITYLKSELNDYLEDIIKMKKEFMYWYPVDVRCSGKDLIGNHLVMCLINHAFIWGDKYLPKQFVINGYLKLNNEKMSKSTGNFLTLYDAIGKYGVDPVCLTLAESDDLDDGNFEELSANSNIQKLTIEREWIENVLKNYQQQQVPTEKDEKTAFYENYIENEINITISNCYKFYKDMKFKRVIHEGISAILMIRDRYRGLHNAGIIKQNQQLLIKIITCLIRIIHPICYHFSEYLILKLKDNGIEYVRHWPDTFGADKVYKYRYCLNTYQSVLSQINSSTCKIKKPISRIDIIIPLKFSKEGNTSIEMAREYTKSGMTKVEYVKHVLKDKNVTDKKLYGPLLTYIIDNINEYTEEWFSFVNQGAEYKTLVLLMPNTINDIKINIVDVPETTDKLFAPNVPFIKINY